MGWKRNLMEAILGTAKWFAPNHSPSPEKSPCSIFVLRNNDLGDLLGCTPMFEALKETWPTCQLAVGVGDWARPILENNPCVDEVLSVNAPWHNKVIDRQGAYAGFRYALFSSEVKALRRKRFDAGIDPLGSPLGSLLMIRCRIPTRIGVRGYAGGHSANTVNLRFDEHRHIGQAALASAALLGAQIESTETRPRLSLTVKEETQGESEWTPANKRRRVVLAPGAGFAEKGWPLENYVSLAKRILSSSPTSMLILGSREDAEMGAVLERETNAETASGESLLRNLCGKTNLRKTFAITSHCDIALSNTSLVMHVAGAFDKPNLVLLGPWYDSAKLHALQWGHEKTIVVGREIAENKTLLASPAEAFEIYEKLAVDIACR